VYKKKKKKPETPFNPLTSHKFHQQVVRNLKSKGDVPNENQISLENLIV